MFRRRPLATALTLALVAPVSALTASAATAAPTRSTTASPTASVTTSVTVPAAAPAAAPTASSIRAKRLPRPATAKGPHRAHDAHTVLVRFRNTASTASRQRAVQRRGGSLGRALPGTGFVTVHAAGAADELASRLTTDPSVAEVTLDYVREASATPNDPGYTYGDQEYLKTVRMPGAWDRSKGSLNTLVAVVDTGVNGRHPDLTGRTVAGYNAITNVGIAAGAASDDKGHGTMVAGIIAAETNNGEGIAGVAWNARVMPVKVLNSLGQGTDSDIVEGIGWAVAHGARIINLSLGGDEDSPVLHDAVRSAVAKGAVVVAAAGNYGDGVPQYPAAYPEVVAVAATDGAGALTDFSTYGSWVDVAAPGWGIVSTGRPDSAGNLYYIGDGTSFSAPIVSGVVALLRTKTPSMTPAQVLARLRATARDAGPRGIDPYYGAGILDATNALGGGYAADLALPAAGANEPNDVPSRATPVPLGDTWTPSATATIGIEGDVDWYRFDSPSPQSMSVTVTPAAYDGTYPQNLDATIRVLDPQLRLIGDVDNQPPGGSESVSLETGSGTYYVAVSNLNGARDARPYTMTVENTGRGVFDPPATKNLDSWQSVKNTAVADVTGDGRADIVATIGDTGYERAGDLYVIPVDTAGSPGTPVPYLTSQRSIPRGLAVGDVDQDGDTDVVVATDLGVQLLRQDAGVLTPAQLIPGTEGSSLVAATDLDADGRLDIVVAIASPAGDTRTVQVRALLQLPDSSWAATDIAGPQEWRATFDLAVGNVDADPRPDVVTLHGGTVTVNHNGGASWSATSTVLDNLDTGQGLELLDATRDGRLDIEVSSTHMTPRVDVLVQAPDGTLGAPVAVPTGSNPNDLTSGDIDGDGVKDLVVLHDGTPSVSVLPQSGSGFARPIVTTTPYIYDRGVGELSTGDLDGDGKVDVVLPSDYGITLLRNAYGITPGHEQDWVRSAWPADFGSGLPVTTAPTVTFSRDVVTSTVTASTVRLVNGRTGAAVPATVTYDAVRRTATVKPSTRLYDWAPYRLLVSGVKDTSGASMTTAYTSTFRTTDLAPPAVGSFRATGALRAATLTWTAPYANDLDRYVVRMATGSTPPSSVAAGTSAYSGTGTKATVPLAQGTTYSFRIWAKDRTGHYSPSSWGRLVGTAESITSNVTSVTRGYPVTVSGRLVRKDTGGPVAGATLQLYWRRVGTSTWTLTATRTSSSTGTFAYAHKPSASVDYMWVYRGSTALVGSSSALRRVTVR